MVPNTPQLSCPFCNADLTSAHAGAPDERVACPRCGEPLPAVLSAQLPADVAPTKARAESVPVSTAPGKTKTVLTILAVMCVMAMASGVFIWFTTDYRRQNDYRTLKQRELTPQLSSDAPILGFLPARCNLLASVHVADLLKQPVTKKLLEAPWPRAVDNLLTRVKDVTGLRLDDIEQLALGAEIANQLPQLFVVMKTKTRYVPRMASSDGLSLPSKYRAGLLYRFALKPVGEGLLWSHSDRIHVVMLRFDAAKTEDLDAIPKEPRSGFDGFSSSLKSALTERRPNGSSMWLAAHLEDAGALGDLLKLTNQKNAAFDVLLTAKTAVLAVETADNPTLTGHFRAADFKSAARLQALLEEHRWPGAQSFKVIGPPPDAAMTEAWVTLQARGDLEAWLGTWLKAGIK